MEKVKIEFDSDAEDRWYNELWGFRTDQHFHFYYDESNNCRKFWIKPYEETGKFNTNIYADFVLAGVAYEGAEREFDVEELRNKTYIPKNAEEIKFRNHFSVGDFLECINHKRVAPLLQWIDDNNLYIHYSHINNIYYALVEIVDSIISIDEIEEFGFDIFSIKSTFYKMLKGKEKEMQSLMYNYCFPNIKKDEIKEFCEGILKLFTNRYQLGPEEKFIEGMIKRASNGSELIFIQNNKDYVMQENYAEFYINPVATYKNSIHIFDEEHEVQKSFEKYEFTRNGELVDNYKFVNGKEDILVQVSDVIAGLLGKLFLYINSNTMAEIRRDVDNLNHTQINNILRLHILRSKADKKNKGFLHSITAKHEIEKLNNFFELVHSRSLKL